MHPFQWWLTFTWHAAQRGDLGAQLRFVVAFVALVCLAAWLMLYGVAACLVTGILAAFLGARVVGPLGWTLLSLGVAFWCAWYLFRGRD